jgi:hypothetical protein
MTGVANHVQIVLMQDSGSDFTATPSGVPPLLLSIHKGLKH